MPGSRPASSALEAAAAGNSVLDLTEMLQLVADTIVESMGFEVAVVNIVDDDETMVVAAVSGPDEVRESLLNRRQGRDGWAKLVEASEPWGRLRFLDHANSVEDPADIFSWVPDIPVSEDPDAWHPEDALFAPLESSEGGLLGMLSVDVPRDGKRPGPATRRALEAFAVTASLAIQHATLAADSRRGIRRFQSVFDTSPVAIALLDADGRFSSVNAAFCGFLARAPHELVGHRPSEYMHPDDVIPGRLLTMTDPRSGHSIDSTAGFPMESRYLLPDGTVVWGRLHLASLDSVDEPSTVIAQVEDVTDRKRVEERLVQQAHFDALTGLPNRALSMLRLQEALSTDIASETATAIFFCDLDRLKLVNDGHGHAVGDLYIREVSRRIRASVRDTDIVGRLSGDEFVVIVRGMRTKAEVIALAGRVVEGVRAPLRLGGVSFTPSLSIGIAYGDPSTTADDLLAQADTAMYRAKLEERGAWYVYDPTMRSSAAAELQLRNDVGPALEQEQFVLHYQPIVRLSDRRVMGREALLRWQHPERGLLGPADFLEVILDSEYESPVTDWLIRRACLDAGRHQGSCRRVSVNISSLQVGRGDLPDVVTRCLAESGLDASDLVLELTEDRLLSRTDGSALLDRLRAVGVSLAIDDFGTGYAGLGYLQRFPAIDIVKVDQSFVSALGKEPVSEHIIRAMVELTKGCGLQLVSEGVETEDQAALLEQLGVPLAQGYLFGRPAPSAAAPADDVAAAVGL
ncbi:MAG TPA: EAL domain-containing protein [Mycobacteriales bacterium]|nr:EAL domain-containing protein [Mycobacteriales bacterium]